MENPEAWKAFLSVSLDEAAALSPDEIARLTHSASAGKSGTTFFGDFANFEDILSRYWDQDIPPEVYYELNSARLRLSSERHRTSDVMFSLAEPNWYVGFSAEFLKSIAKMDKLKRARILEAISKISEAPLTPHGDTVKPLTANYSGLWRYRIGEDRLIYKASATNQRIVLISFGARGGVYD